MFMNHCIRTNSAGAIFAILTEKYERSTVLAATVCRSQHFRSLVVLARRKNGHFDAFASSSIRIRLLVRNGFVVDA